MNTRTLPVISFLAVIAAFVVLPVSAVAACIGLSVTGMISVLAADYGRGVEPLSVQEPVAPFAPSRLAHTEYRVAA
ncbi:MAG TPA: hypothetical protein VN775_09915 [Opitutaceae bacterium]|nr:hypothetical protein [Opitutaceae bacterium]